MSHSCPARRRSRRSGASSIAGKALAPLVQGIAATLQGSCTNAQRRAALRALNEVVDGGGVTDFVGMPGRAKKERAVALFVDRGAKPTIVYDMVANRTSFTTAKAFRKSHAKKYKIAG